MERADLEQWKSREVARLLALVEAERRYYQEIAASIPVGLLVLSSDLAIVSANRAIRSIFGLTGSPLRTRLDTLLPSWVLERAAQVLTAQRLSVCAQVGRQRLGGAIRQQSLTEENDDRNRPQQQRHTDQREREEAERSDAGLLRGLRHEDVDGAAGEREL